MRRKKMLLSATIKNYFQNLVKIGQLSPLFIYLNFLYVFSTFKYTFLTIFNQSEYNGIRSCNFCTTLFIFFSFSDLYQRGGMEKIESINNVAHRLIIIS